MVEMATDECSGPDSAAIFGATEGRFKYTTILSIQWPQPGGEDLGLREEFQISLEAKLPILKSLLEHIDKFVPAEEYLLDALADYQVEPDDPRVPSPTWHGSGRERGLRCTCSS